MLLIFGLRNINGQDSQVPATERMQYQKFNFVDLLTHYLNSDENVRSVIGKQSSSLVQSSLL